MTDADRKREHKPHGQTHISELEGLWTACVTRVDRCSGLTITIEATDSLTKREARVTVSLIALAAGWPSIVWSKAAEDDAFTTKPPARRSGAMDALVLRSEALLRRVVREGGAPRTEGGEDE